MNSRNKYDLRILVAEDEVINNKYMTLILAENGYKVDSAKNGREVLAKLKDNEYDLILMDINMPKMNGIEATLKIRETEKNSKKHLIIFALTAYGHKEEIKRFIDAGMDDYIIKPFNENVFFNKIERAFHNY